MRRIWDLLRARPDRVLISLLLAAFFVWLFRRGGLPLVPGEGAFEKQTWWAIPVYVGGTFVAGFLRTYRWVYLLRPLSDRVSRWRVLGMGYVGFAAVFLAPLRMGEVVRPYLLAQDGRVTFLQAVGTVAAERVVDGLVLTLLAAVALASSTLTSPLPDRLGDLPLPVKAVPGALTTTLALFALAFVLMAAFYWARAEARATVQRVVGLVSPRLAAFSTTALERLSDGLRFLPSRTNFLLFMTHTLAYWAIGAASQWALLRGVGIPTRFSEACVTLGVMGIGSLIPSGPGLFGAYQISAYTGLALFFDRATLVTAGAAFVFLSYTTQLLVNTLCCVLGFWLMNRFSADESSVA